MEKSRKNTLTDCEHCFNNAPSLVDYSKSFYCFCWDFDKIYDDQGYIYKGDICPKCNEIWVVFVRRETIYEGNVREIAYAKFSVEKFNSISLEEWDKHCDELIYAQPYLSKGVNIKSLIFSNPSFFIEDI